MVGARLRLGVVCGGVVSAGVGGDGECGPECGGECRPEEASEGSVVVGFFCFDKQISD